MTPNADWQIIWECLIHAIRTNSGIGFINNDQGHPAYIVGADENSGRGMGDSPKKNKLYQMLLDLSEDYGQEGTRFRNWREFCKFAIDSANAAKRR